MKTVSLILFSLLALSNVYGQSFSTRTYIDSLPETGLNIAIDSGGNSYIFSSVREGEEQGALIRKTDRNGNLIGSISISRDAGFDLHPKDIIINRSGNVLCTYLRDKSGSVVFDQFNALHIQEFDENFTPIQDQKLLLDSRASFSHQVHIAQLSDGSYAVMSPQIRSTDSGSEFSAMLSKLDESLTMNRSIKLNLSPSRARCFALVEEDNLILGAPGQTGAEITKVNLLDSIIIWEKTLPFSGVTFNRIYNVVPLDNLSGYSFITNYGNNEEDQSGVVYFETDLAGDVTQVKLFNEYTWLSSFFPSMSRSSCGDMTVTYTVFDTTNSDKTRFLQIEQGGIVSKDTLLNLTPGDTAIQFTREFIPFIGDTLIGVGTVSTSDTTSLTLMVKLVGCDTMVTVPVRFVHRTEGFKTFPNPNSTGTLYFNDDIISPREISSYQIVNQFGEVLRNGEINISNSVNVRGLKTGIYYLIIDGNSKQLFSRFIIKAT